jgi:hypothetical protein
MVFHISSIQNWGGLEGLRTLQMTFFWDQVGGEAADLIPKGIFGEATPPQTPPLIIDYR